MKRLLKFFLVTISYFLYSFCSYAETSFLIKEFLVFEDKSNIIKIEDIVGDSSSIKFNPVNADLFEIENVKNTYWIKYVIHNNTSEKAFLLQGNPNFDLVELYIPTEKSELRHQRAGLSLPFYQRLFKHRDLIFMVPADEKEIICYMKVQSDIKIGLQFFLQPYHQIFNEATSDYYYSGFFFGIICIIIFYNLIFYFKTRETLYLYYFLYVLSFGVFAVVDWGFIYAFLDKKSFQWNRDYYTIPFACITIFLLLYTAKFLNTKERMPKAHNFLKALIWGRIVVFFLGKFFFDILYQPYIDNMFLFFAFVLGVISLKQGYKPAKYFVMAFAALFVGMILHTIKVTCGCPDILIKNGLYIIGIIEIILFSLALADRFRILKEENKKTQAIIIRQLMINEELKDKINLELEDKVRERTEIIQRQAMEIERMNALLKEDNNRLTINLKNIAHDRVMQKEVTFDDFKKIYPDDEACLDFLEQLKWKDGYVCKKCGNQKFGAGNMVRSRRCSKCHYDESLTAGTIFYRLKFPLVKAFYLMFVVSLNPEVTSESLGKMIELPRITCSGFKKKILSAISKKGKDFKKSFQSWEVLIPEEA